MMEANSFWRHDFVLSWLFSIPRHEKHFDSIVGSERQCRDASVADTPFDWCQIYCSCSVLLKGKDTSQQFHRYAPFFSAASASPPTPPLLSHLHTHTPIILWKNTEIVCVCVCVCVREREGERERERESWKAGKRKRGRQGTHWFLTPLPPPLADGNLDLAVSGTKAQWLHWHV